MHLVVWHLSDPPYACSTCYSLMMGPVQHEVDALASPDSSWFRTAEFSRACRDRIRAAFCAMRSMSRNRVEEMRRSFLIRCPLGLQTQAWQMLSLVYRLQASKQSIDCCNSPASSAPINSKVAVSINVLPCCLVRSLSHTNIVHPLLLPPPSSSFPGLWPLLPC